MPTFAPGYRVAYERDGSAVYRYGNDGSPDHPSEADWKDINDESSAQILLSDTPSSHPNVTLAVVFPVPLHIVGLFWATNSDSFGGGNWVQYIDYSSDTTNGWDGTWTELAEQPTFDDGQVPVFASYRTLIASVNQSGVKGLRTRIQGNNVGNLSLCALHIYAAAQESYLKLWHPTLDEELPYDHLDWGTVIAGEADVRQFRVKNTRALQADDVSIDALTYTNGDNTSYHSFSLDGVTYERPLNVGDLGAGAISDPIYVRYAPSENATVTIYATQVSAIPAQWVT